MYIFQKYYFKASVKGLPSSKRRLKPSKRGLLKTWIFFFYILAFPDVVIHVYVDLFGSGSARHGFVALFPKYGFHQPSVLAGYNFGKIVCNLSSDFKICHGRNIAWTKVYINFPIPNVRLGLMVHPQNVQLLDVQLQNVQLQNVLLPDVQLQNVQITKRPDYQTSLLPNVQITKRPVTERPVTKRPH